MGWGWNVVIAQPGPFHSECRTIFKRAIGPNEVVKHDPLIQEEAKNLLGGLEKVRGDPWEVVQSYVPVPLDCPCELTQLHILINPLFIFLVKFLL
jgi:cytochrome P450